MTTIEERSEYLNNPYYEKPLYGDFSPFYITIAVCTVLCAIIFIVNLVLGCCSKHRQYWQDRHTGNRWIVSLWTATPHKNPPLDLTELEDVSSFYPKSADIEHPEVSYHRPQQEQRGYGRAYNSQSQPAEEYVELQQKRETVAFVLALIIGVIIILLKWGPRICGVRHHALPDDHRRWDDDERAAYDHGISYA